MTQIQISLDETENEIVEIYQATHKLKRKQDTIKAIIKELKPKIDRIKESMAS